MKKPNDEGNLHANHRERMRQRVLKGGTGSMHEHEMLEMLLFLPIPRVNTNPIAHRLINRFGSLPKVFEATPEELVTVKGVGKASAAYIVMVRKLFDRINSIKRIRRSGRTGKEQVYAACKEAIVKAKECGVGKVVVAFYNIAREQYTGEVYDAAEVSCRQILELSMRNPSNVVIIAEKVTNFSKSVTRPLVPFLKLADITLMFDFVITENACFEMCNGELVDYIEF